MSKIALCGAHRTGKSKLGMELADALKIPLLESHMGNLILSKDKAEILKAWDKISLACESGEPLTGTVIAKVKGGLSVDIGVDLFVISSSFSS
jgi:small subunit ribosomal protein S1